MLGLDKFSPALLSSCFFLLQVALRDDVFENGSCDMQSKRLSFSLSDTAEAGPPPAQYNPEITVTPPPPDTESLYQEEEAEPQEAEPVACEREAEPEWVGPGGSPCLDAGEMFLDPGVSDALLRDEGSELKPVELDTDEGSLTKQLVKRLTSGDMLPEGPPGWGPEEAPAPTPGSSSLEEAIQGLLLRLEGLEERGRELQELEQEVMRLEDLLKVRWLFSMVLHGITVSSNS